MGRTPNRTRWALLGFLSWGAQTGYGLRKVIDGSVSNFWSESYGRIYPMLSQLVEEGLATSREERTPGGRPTKTYEITEAGRRALDAWYEESPAPGPRRNELLLKLFFAARSEAASPKKMLTEYRDEVLEELDRYAETRSELEAADASVPDVRYWLMTLRYGELDANAHLQWVDEALAMLDSEGEGEGAS